MSDERTSFYYIPENYLDETRILQGQIRVRYLVDGVILALVLALLQCLIPVTDYKARISLLVAFSAPGLLLGLTGYNGDPVSAALKNLIAWKKTKEILRYNHNPRLLTKTPIEVSLTETTARDKVVDAVQGIQQRRADRRNNAVYIEGETFRFSDDPSVSQYISEEDETFRKQAMEAKRTGREADGTE